MCVCLINVMRNLLRRERQDPRFIPRNPACDMQLQKRIKKEEDAVLLFTTFVLIAVYYNISYYIHIQYFIHGMLEKHG